MALVRVVVMMVNEEYKKDDQVSNTWRSRVERERFNISLSVEQTLEDHTSDQDFWDDGTSSYQMNVTTGSKRSESHIGRTIVPPRLSLQSRFLPAMSAEPAFNGSQRFATRILRTQTAGSYSKHVPAATVPQQIPRTEEKFTFPYPVYEEKQQEAYDHLPQLPFPDVFPAIPASTPFYRAENKFYVQNESVVQTEQRKQRLAGKATRVRLQAVAHAKGVPVSQAEIHTNTDQLSSVYLKKQTPVTGVHTTGFTVQSKEREYKSASSEVSCEFQGFFARKARGVLSGHGEFACGQSEVIIENTYISLVSVVLVTLTSRPGPVVVQYISLIPHEGFTVHLTAPTSIHTTFNYIILPGELF